MEMSYPRMTFDADVLGSLVSEVGDQLYTQLYMPNYISLFFYAFFQDTPTKETEVSWALGAVTAGPDT